MNEQLQKAFALSCRILADYAGCPAEVSEGKWEAKPNCMKDEVICEGANCWKCWQDYLLDRAADEPICRACGCTQDRACDGGCEWVEENLCSRCVNEAKGGE